MPIAFLTAEKLNLIVSSLTPMERLRAAGQFNTDFLFIITGVAAIMILTALLFIISFHRIAQEHKISKQSFLSHAEKKGLSERECQILLDIADKTGLKRNESIFTMLDAFDQGADQMIKESLAQQEVEQSRWLRTEISFLREKLGFQKKPQASIGSSTKSQRPSSRQIPIDKIVHITRRKSYELADIEAVVINNDDTELTVKIKTPLESKPGELWRARYHFGTSVWEFDTSVIGCKDDILILNHSDNIRFINRRRFLRVPVNMPAFVARFPFSRTLPSDKSMSATSHVWGPPEFIPATITELGGPGLRLEVPTKITVGDRVVVIFKLIEANKYEGNSPAANTFPKSASVRKHQTSQSKIVEDIGEVRNIRDIQDGFSIAVELTGLSDSNLSELIRATNAFSLSKNDNQQELPDSTETEEKVSGLMVLQGV